MNINSKLLDQLLPHADSDELTFVPVYRIYLEMLDGDYEASALLAEILRLQNSEGGKANGGWVVFSYNNAQKRFFMGRTAFTRVLKVLSCVGLKTERRPSPHYDNSVMPYHRIDIDVLKQAVINFHEHGISPLPKKRKASTEHTGGGVQNVQGGVFNPYTIEEVDLEEVSKRVHTVPTDDVVAPQKSIPSDTPNTHSHSKGTGDSDINPNVSTGDNELENVPPRADTPPAPRKRKPKKDSVNNRADAPKGGYQVVFGAVAKYVFEISDIDQAPPKLIGLVAGYLWGSNKSMQAPRPQTETDEERANNIVKDVQAFSVWYKRKYSDAVLPRDLAKFAGHWLAFWANRKNVYTPRKDEGVVWGATVDEQNSEQGSNIHYIERGGGKMKLMDLILSGQTNSEDEK